jgi:DNA polymerase III subunit epsilon
MRQIVLDTETTGLEVERGHRIIEIGCVELLNRRPSGRFFHHYLNPERAVDEGARAIHGLTRERLEDEPKFAAIAPELRAFIEGAELIIHNAVFDLAFLDREFALLGEPPAVSIRAICQVLDTLLLARARHPGQRNNLDALAKRYGIDTSHRELHGALLDARILADVYLAMTGGQSALALDEAGRERAAASERDGTNAPRPAGALPVIAASAEECAAHQQLQQLLDQASGGKCLWRTLDASLMPGQKPP